MNLTRVSLRLLLPRFAGVALVAIGAAELAWIWLVPAAITALVPHVPRARWLAPVARWRKSRSDAQRTAKRSIRRTSSAAPSRR